MEQARLLIAIVLSALVFLVWQFFFVDREADQKIAKKTTEMPAQTEQAQSAKPYAAEQKDALTQGVIQPAVAKPAVTARQITVETALYTAKISEKGAGFTSFVLKNYREDVSEDSAPKEIIPQDGAPESVLIGYAGKSTTCHHFIKTRANHRQARQALVFQEDFLERFHGFRGQRARTQRVEANNQRIEL